MNVFLHINTHKVLGINKSYIVWKDQYFVKWVMFQKDM